MLCVCAGSGICQRGGQDGVPAGVSPENTASCQYFRVMTLMYARNPSFNHVGFDQMTSAHINRC